MPDILAKLNKAQNSAVTHLDGPLLVVAGAGTGKTTVLIERLAYLILEKKVLTDDILLLTFTEKAAGEMEERADKILPYGYTDLWISTFHSFGERILREHALEIGLTPSFKLLSDTDQWVLIKKNLTRFKLDYYRPLGNPTKFISELLKHFSRLKDEDISPEEYLHYVEELKSDQDQRLGGEKNITVKKNDQERDKFADLIKGENMMETSRIKELAEAYHTYNQLLLENDFLDFGDLIIYTIKLFRDRPNILRYYREKFKYIMVDEFQDTNLAQYELVKLLAAPKNNLLVTGDDDQCLPANAIISTKTGEKTINRIKPGDEVVTAVGKGHMNYSSVNYVNSTIKKTNFITFFLKSGKSLIVTDNHKLFCFISKIANKKYYYVYLIFKQNLGWRISLSNSLATILKFKKRIDNVLIIGCYFSLEEAKFNEVLLSLKYKIPTIDFQGSSIIDKKFYLEKLQKSLKIDNGARALFRDLNIDYNSSPFTSLAIKKGGKGEARISIEMCTYYKSKNSKKEFSSNSQVFHELNLETSNRQLISQIENLGFKMSPIKKGKKLRVRDNNLSALGAIAKKLQPVAGKIIDLKMNLTTTKTKHPESLVIPAKNIFPGMYLPITSKGKIVYEEIIKREEKTKKARIYDLEVDKTHNFSANGIIVHNSIYKFRGASISNIMQFKEDFPQAKEIVLIENYRSRQEILDRAHEFIKYNNPNRLEEKLKINKSLKAKNIQLDKNNYGPAVKFFNFKTEEEEVSFVVSKIKDIYWQKNKKNKEANWLDFAILVRANNTADAYVKELNRQNIPNQFMSWRGLYYKPLILDILAYFRLLDDYHESSALFRVLSMEAFKVSHSDMVAINKMARRKVWSLYETLKNINSVSGISAVSLKNIKKLLKLIEEHSRLAIKSKPTEIFLRFVYDSNLLKNLDRDRDLDQFSYLNQFYQKIKKLEESSPDLKLKDFLEAINLELEAGETGVLKLDFADNDTVKIMTVHGAKGLEFKYVFIVNLSEKKFPTISRNEKINIPEQLLKEKIIVGKEDHLEEERRLFYVALTRAKEELYLSSAKDYGGVREKKPSRFIIESGLDPGLGEKEAQASYQSEFLRDLDFFKVNSEEGVKNRQEKDNYPLPAQFSFSQLAAFSTCPLQYKFAFVLKIPAPFDKPVLIFGKSLHNILYNFLFPVISGEKNKQKSLFSEEIGSEEKLINEKRLIELYKEYWQTDGYNNKEERDQYQQKGKLALRRFLKDYKTNPPLEIIFLEKKFSFKIGGNVIKGTIDRVDRLSDGSLEIIDYKSGSTKEKLDFKQKRQLILYQLFLEEYLQKKVGKLTYYYLESGEKLSFTAEDKDKDKLKEQILKEMQAIKKRNFAPTPTPMCRFCDFRDICEFRQI
jgi:DNA helicase II / ATP-dependent DNA helicase PcrA